MKDCIQTSLDRYLGDELTSTVLDQALQQDLLHSLRRDSIRRDRARERHLQRFFKATSRKKGSPR